ncbi:MAG: pilus assembly protein PilM [Planctomycetota bacterium]|nr:pilus assembly protein PilM [Planctomycetota bacterium]
MARATGIEIGRNAIRIVEAESTSKGIRIARAAAARLPEPLDKLPDDRVAAILREMLKAGKFSTSTVTTSVDASDSVIRELSLPFKSEDQIRKTIKFEMESHIHHAPIEDMIVDYTRVFPEGKTKDTELLLVAAVPQTAASRPIRILELVDAEPEAIDFDVLAAFNAFEKGKTFEKTPTCVLLLLDNDTVKMLLVEEGRARIARAIHFSSPPVTGGTAAQHAPKKSAVETSKDNEPAEAEPDAPALLNDLAIQKLAHEIERLVISAVPSDAPAVVLVAANELIPESLEPFATSLRMKCGVPVIPTDILSRFTLSQEVTAAPPNASMAVAIGLAIRGLGLSSATMNFRRETLTYHRGIDTLKVTAVWTLALVSVLLCLLAIYARQRLKNAEKKLAELRSEQSAIFEEIYPGVELPKGMNPFLEMKRLYEEDRDLFDPKKQPMKVSALEYWKELFNRIGTQKIFTVDSLEINISRERIQMKGITSDMMVAEQVLTNIKGATDEQKQAFPEFTRARSLGYETLKDGTVKYTYEIPLK